MRRMKLVQVRPFCDIIEYGGQLPHGCPTRTANYSHGNSYWNVCVLPMLLLLQTVTEVETPAWSAYVWCPTRYRAFEPGRNTGLPFSLLPHCTCSIYGSCLSGPLQQPSVEYFSPFCGWTTTADPQLSDALCGCCWLSASQEWSRM